MKKIQSLISKWREAMLLLLLLISQIGQAQITPSDYEHTMSVTSQMSVDGTLNTIEGYSIQVYDGDELLGTSEYNTPINEGLYSFMTVYSNGFFGEYSLQITTPDGTTEVIGTLSFESNSILGSIANPEVYSIGSEIQGCTDEVACNFNVIATEDDGLCTYANLFYTCAGVCINDMDSDGECDELEVNGCVNSSASNYNQSSTNDDGTCVSWEDAFLSSQFTIDSLELALENAETHNEVDRYIDIPIGWSMFGYTCADSVNVVDAFGLYSDSIEIIKDEWGLAWIVEYGPESNFLGHLRYGQGYQIKNTGDSIEEFQFCPNIE
jgi:hypothetical protein